MQLIDTHIHLADTVYRDQRPELLDRARRAGINRWITIGTNLEDSRLGIELAAAYTDLYCSVGVHPHEAGKQDKSFLKDLSELARQDKVCAIGEIGLDYYYDFSDSKLQVEVFSQQLELATKMNLPIVVHCREAQEQCLDIIREQKIFDYPVVFHCFGGDVKQARQILDAGFFLSFTGIITFKNAITACESASYAPLDRIMLETDCPYLSPEPKRNIRPNEPALLIHIAEKMARLKEISLEEIARQTSFNACRFFKLDI